MKGMFFVKRCLIVCAVILCLTVFFAGSAIADDEVKVGILRFSSNTVDVGSDQASVIGDVITQRLSMADNLNILGQGEISAAAEGEKISMSGYISTKNAIKLGKAADCKYVVAGTITNLKMKESTSGVAFIGAFGSHKAEATAAAEIRVIDVEAEEVRSSFSETAHASQSGSYVGIMGISSENMDLNGMQQAAISELAAKITMRVRDIVGDPVTVTKASAKSITLGIGTMGGANKGSLYRIYTGSGKREQNIAVVKVTEADSESSTAVIADKQNVGNLSLVRKGDKVIPIDSQELKELQKSKKFAKSRPKEK